MAVDTVLKRQSATLILLPFRGWVYPVGTGVEQVERQTVTYAYSGPIGAIWDTFGPKKGLLLDVYP